MNKIVTIIGARPQFIKAATVSRVIRNQYSNRLKEVLVHTGQHYDENMSKIFFDELDIPHPSFNLEIAGGGHGAMTGRMLEGIENILLSEKPDWVLVYGDTNSTLAGALAAVKLHIPVAHVEAGLRSFNMRMPEEVNRILTDRVSSLLLCPTKSAVDNLASEGMSSNASLVGDVMYDASIHYRNLALEKSSILERLHLKNNSFILATCHRAENTDQLSRLRGIAEALAILALKHPVVFPLHPRTAKILSDEGLMPILKKVLLVDPLSFLDMIRLEQSAMVILTDSGGVQKEAFFYEVPCVTLRDETEWVETVELGWNKLTGASTDLIVETALSAVRPSNTELLAPYGNGRASEKILSALLD
jgi:UDP-GlcNAc3NAcA epimerase